MAHNLDTLCISVRPWHGIEVRNGNYHINGEDRLRTAVWFAATPGNQRRSLLGMVKTDPAAVETFLLRYGCRFQRQAWHGLDAEIIVPIERIQHDRRPDLEPRRVPAPVRIVCSNTLAIHVDAPAPAPRKAKHLLPVAMLGGRNVCSNTLGWQAQRNADYQRKAARR